VLDDPEALRANHPLKGVWRVTPSGDLEHRLLDPRVPHGARIDQLRIEDVCRRVEARTALITPEAYAIDRGLPHAHLGHPLPLLPHPLEAAVGMKHVQDARPPWRQMRPHTTEQPLDLGLRFQLLKHPIRGNDKIEAAAQGKVGDVAAFRPGFGRGDPCVL